MLLGHLSTRSGIDISVECNHSQEGIVSTETSSLGTAGFFARSWWVLLLRGLFAVILGVLVFTKPVWTLGVVMLAFKLLCTHRRSLGSICGDGWLASSR